jgi:two-component system, NtrC family, sensor kinase
MRELRQQFVNALLAVMTVTALIAAVLNFQQQGKYRLPVDGVTWVDDAALGHPVAALVDEGSPAARAGIRVGDTLLSIASAQITNAAHAAQVLATLGAWRRAEYHVIRDGVEAPAMLVVGEAKRDAALYYQYFVGAAYLAIGLYVYIRRRGAPRALHFFLLCLLSFVMSTFHYTGKLNNFDKVMYLGNVVAGYLVPALFLHFACCFPEEQRWIRRRGAAFLLYIPGLALLGAHLSFTFALVTTAQPLVQALWALDRAWLVYLCGLYLVGAAVFHWQRTRSVDAITRRQLTWLRNGALAGILPFTIFYAIPFLAGNSSGSTNLAVLSLPLIPLTWAYAILRYRLMDVDVIFEQGAVYTLATLAVLGLFYGLLISVHGAEEMSGLEMGAVILTAAFIFQPIRNWIRELLNRYVFYKDRYDFRRTLIDFARELGSPTDLHEMLLSVAGRLIHTLDLHHVAFFVREESGEEFRLELAYNRRGEQTRAVPDLELSFLNTQGEGQLGEGKLRKPYLFFERTRHLLDVVSREISPSARKSIADLDLTYFFPCAVRGRTIAYLGVSRTDAGDFLSSEDIQLVQTLSGYLGIAIDNSRLYASLQRKADEYERLKEFSENIVESIHVGILAADLEDRVESWNSRMERLTGVSRGDALGRSLDTLLPLGLCGELQASRSDSGLQNIYQYDFAAKQATLNIATAPLFAKDGQRIGRLIIFDDVTDRAEFERRLVQADKLSSIGLLAAGVAHEVNTPLAVISTYAQMLAKQISADDQKAPLLEKIARQTFRASEIVNSLLNFSRVAPTEHVAVDLNQTIRETLALVDHQLVQSRIEVLYVPGDGTVAKGSPGKLQQVFLNLIMNARDAMPLGGQLRIVTSFQASTVRVSVADSGAGIAAEVLPRIFDPFFTTKADATITPSGGRKGTGLGLSVSYGIIREHGGEIDVESVVGKGACFTITLPAMQPYAGSVLTEIAPLEERQIAMTAIRPEQGEGVL